MEDKERQQKAYLVVLICCTIFIIALSGESLLLGWEISTALLLMIGDAICWWIHINKKLPAKASLWVNVGLSMITFFFYGSHETSMYDIAAVIIVLMIMYSATDDKNIINLCLFTYYATLVYDLVWVLKGFGELEPLTITRLLLHVGIVYMACYVIKLDIDRRQKQRTITEKKIDELEKSNRRIEDFLTNVSHELRTPINAVIGITTTMLRDENNASRRKDILSIQMAGHRLFNQVEDILDFTEIDTGSVIISDDSYMVSSLINDIISGNRLVEKDNKIELIINIDPSMPAVLSGDGRKIKKIIKHLIDNGLKFTKEGGVYVKIYTMPKPYGVNLCIKVTDTGIGMSEEELSRIKERFYQTNSGRDRKAGGLGLGLSIVYGLVSSMEGFIQIDSEKGKGTTVSISIPQKVLDSSSHMTVREKDRIFIGCFIEMEKFLVPEVRTFYNETLSSLVNGLDVSLRSVTDIDELKRLVSKYQLSHLFVGKDEYLKYRSYIEELDKSIEVVVVSDDELKLPVTGQFKLLTKPFYCLPVVNILNSGTMDEHMHGGYMSCPGVKVLVVDDEPMNLMVAEGVFKGYKMVVKTARSGKEAIDICSKETFDLIFLDHMMPEMDGVETLKRLRKLHLEDVKPLTIIAFTANAVSGAREMFLDEGFDEFISKPIEDCELQRVLRRMLPKSVIVYTDKCELDNTDNTDNTDNVNNINNALPEVNEAETADKPSETEDIRSDEYNLAGLAASGIDIKSGISYCSGDVAFYKELLMQYADSEDAKKADMERFFAAKDWDNYRIQVHSLKSTSKMIGQDVLSEMARAVEEAAKEHDADYIMAHHSEVMAKYQELADTIHSVLGKPDEAVESGKTDMEDNVSDIMNDIELLKQSLDTFESDKAMDVLKMISDKNYQDDNIDKLLEDIRYLVDDFEFEAAIDKADAIISILKGGEADES